MTCRCNKTVQSARSRRLFVVRLFHGNLGGVALAAPGLVVDAPQIQAATLHRSASCSFRVRVPAFASQEGQSRGVANPQDPSSLKASSLKASKSLLRTPCRQACVWPQKSFSVAREFSPPKYMHVGSHIAVVLDRENAASPSSSSMPFCSTNRRGEWHVYV